jgi:hypothetical protein
MKSKRKSQKEKLLLGLLLCVLCASAVNPAAQEQKAPEPALAVSEVERLKYENLVTKLQLVRLQKDALAEQYRKLLEEEGRLQQEIPTLLREILKAHGHPDGSIDWEKRRVVPKPPEQKKPEEKKQ